MSDEETKTVIAESAATAGPEPAALVSRAPDATDPRAPACDVGVDGEGTRAPEGSGAPGASGTEGLLGPPGDAVSQDGTGNGVDGLGSQGNRMMLPGAGSLGTKLESVVESPLSGEGEASTNMSSPSGESSLVQTGSPASDVGTEAGKDEEEGEGKHNKYCHFCQHVKLRASAMMACENKGCARRYCEHCLTTQLKDDLNKEKSSSWVNGKWTCPVCRKICCCASQMECNLNHRHCKAYRYRRRRAEQAAKKQTAQVSGQACLQACTHGQACLHQCAAACKLCTQESLHEGLSAPRPHESLSACTPTSGVRTPNSGPRIESTPYNTKCSPSHSQRLSPPPDPRPSCHEQPAITVGNGMMGGMVMGMGGGVDYASMPFRYGVAQDGLGFKHGGMQVRELNPKHVTPDPRP
jgi:hypothetical protein